LFPFYIKEMLGTSTPFRSTGKFHNFEHHLFVIFFHWNQNMTLKCCIMRDFKILSLDTICLGTVSSLDLRDTTRLHFAVHCYTYEHIYSISLSTFTSSIPLLSSGCQQQTSPPLWFQKCSWPSATSYLPQLHSTTEPQRPSVSITLQLTPQSTDWLTDWHLCTDFIQKTIPFFLCKYCFRVYWVLTWLLGSHCLSTFVVRRIIT
jgi:hypothetical protein